MNDYACIVDKHGSYVEYVVLSNGEVQFYDMKSGEAIVDIPPPALKSYAGTEGLIKPKLQNGEWVEGASLSEIEQWEEENPMPEPAAPSPIEALQAENNLLKAQIAAATDRQDFLEDCIAEMAMRVYSA